MDTQHNKRPHTPRQPQVLARRGSRNARVAVFALALIGAVSGVLSGLGGEQAQAQRKSGRPGGLSPRATFIPRRTFRPFATAMAKPTIRVTDQIGPNDRMEMPSWMVNRQLLGAKTVDEFIEKLPNWATVNKPKPDKSQETRQGTSKENHDGRDYNVTRTKYSITDTPEEIVTFQPVNAFWLGALVQGKGLRLGLGSMEEIPVPDEKRAPMRVKSSLNMGNNSRAISSPGDSAVNGAIGDLMQQGNNTQWGSVSTLNVEENHSEEQTATELGLSARYMTARVKASLKAERSASRHSVSAAFIQRAFTATADLGGRTRRAAFFNDNFTIADAHALVNQGRITTGNLPTYIKSISYGRVVIFTLTSNQSEEKMKAAVEGSYNAVAADINVNASVDSKLKTANFQLRVTQFGGPQDGFQALIPENQTQGITNALGVMRNFLKQPAPLTTMLPISYTANTLRDDQLAAMSSTTSYTVTKYAGNPIGERFRIKMWVDITGSDDGAFDNTLECFGSLRVNGDLWWEIPREEAGQHQREKGEGIDISNDPLDHHFKQGRETRFLFDSFYDNRVPFKFELRIRDKDSGSKNDDVGVFNNTLDLANIAQNGGERTWVWDGGEKNDEASRLHIKVERVDFL